MEYQSQGEGVQNLEHLCRVLRLMGLSNNEIRVYTTLLLNGPLTTPQLAEHLSVHRVQVYTVLRKLVSRGLVEVAQGKPMVYRAVEPEVLLEKFLSEVQNLRERALEEVRRLREVRRGTGEEVAGVWILKTLPFLMTKVRKLLESATHDVIICGTPAFVKQFTDVLQSLERSGVVVYTLLYLGKTGQGTGLGEVLGLRKVRYTLAGDLITVIDSRVAVLVQRRGSVEPRYGLVIEEPVIIDYLTQYLFTRWLNSAVITDEEVTAPVRFTMHRFAVYEISRLLRSSAEVRVRVHGYWQDGRECHLEGLVEGVKLDVSTDVVNLTLRTGEKTYSVGGPDATLEDIAAQEIEVLEVRRR